MGAYILRRLLLMIPTLFGIMVVNFVLIQFVPGGPVEQVLAQLEGEGDVFAGISGGGNEGGSASEIEDSYQGARGLPPQFLDELRVQFNFARIVCEEGFTGEPDLDAEECTAEDIPGIQRFGLMMWDYLRFDFGESYFRSISVVDLVIEKMPVSITLGLWSTLIAYLVSIPLGIRKAVRDGSRFDTFTSGLIIVAYAIPGFLFAILLLVLFAGGRYLQIFPLRGLVSDGWEDMTLIRQDRRLLLAHHAAGAGLDHLGLRLPDTPDEEQLPRRDQEAVRDDRQGQGPERAAGPLRPCLPQRDADRDRGFPLGVPRRLLRGLGDHRDDLFARRAGAAGLRGGGEPGLPGDIRHAIRLRPDRSGRRDPVGPDVCLDRSAHRLRDAGDLRRWRCATTARRPPGRRFPPHRG
jgi:ABC-type dipeptide/oligopeptide/nickel transport system permease component